MSLPNDRSDAPKIPSGKGKRLIVLHAGMRSEGLIDGCDLVFLAKSKDVSLDFDILIESFISLCIIETVLAIFREYKPWILLLITQ
jgi:hypothetical protein